MRADGARKRMYGHVPPYIAQIIAKFVSELLRYCSLANAFANLCKVPKDNKKCRQAHKQRLGNSLFTRQEFENM